MTHTAARLVAYTAYGSERPTQPINDITTTTYFLPLRKHYLAAYGERHVLKIEH